MKRAVVGSAAWAQLEPVTSSVHLDAYVRSVATHDRSFKRSRDVVPHSADPSIAVDVSAAEISHGLAVPHSGVFTDGEQDRETHSAPRQSSQLGDGVKSSYLHDWSLPRFAPELASQVTVPPFASDDVSVCHSLGFCRVGACLAYFMSKHDDAIRLLLSRFHTMGVQQLPWRNGLCILTGARTHVFRSTCSTHSAITVSSLTHLLKRVLVSRCCPSSPQERCCLTAGRHCLWEEPARVLAFTSTRAARTFGWW